MAAREVTERRLRPIYDAIDNGQFKKAVQLADKMIKKQSDLICAKALKALALHRMGKGSESQQVSEEVMRMEPYDDPTLQAMTLYYRETNQPEKVCEIYDTAVKICPKNDELLSHLFMSYVRVQNYHKQQQTALALHKVVPNNPYYFWGVMSIFMQGYTNPAMEKTMYLPLAERMVEKFMEEKKIDAEAEVKMYIMILDRLEKYEKITELLEGPLGSRISGPEEHGRLLIESLLKSGKLEHASLKLTELIQKNPDQWSYYVDYITVMVQLSCSNPQHLQKAHSFITSIVNEQDKDGKLSARAPYLAQLELLRQLKAANWELEWKQVLDLESPVVGLMAYFEKFGSKICFFEDVHIFIPLLLEEEKKSLLERMASFVETHPISYECSEDDRKLHVSRMQQHIALLQMRRLCGGYCHLSAQEKEALALAIHCDYIKGLKLGEDVYTTECHPADSYIILYAHLMFEVYQETKQHSLLVDTAVVLETARRRSQGNAQISLLLLKLYTKLGVFERCAQIYDILDIKQIQVDTVGYLLHRCMMTSGIFPLCKDFFEFSLKFYWNAGKEVGEYVIQSYKNGSFHVVIELADLQKRLSQSYSWHLLQLRKQLLTLTHSIHSLPDFKQNSLHLFSPEITITAEELVDNRDLKVFDDYGPPGQMLTAEDAKSSFHLECVYFEFLMTAMKGIKMAVHITEADSDCPSFREVLCQLEAVIKKARDHPLVVGGEDAVVRLIPIRAPPLCEIAALLKYNFDKAILIVLKTVLTLKDSKTDDKIEAQVKESLESVVGIFEDVRIDGLSMDDYATLQNIIDGGSQDECPDCTPLDMLKKSPIATETLAVFTQVVSVAALLCECATEIIGGCHSNSHMSKRKKKRKQEKSCLEACRPHFAWFIDAFMNVIDRVCHQIKLFPKAADISDLMKKLTVNEKYAPEKDLPTEINLYQTFAESYNTSFSECEAVLKHKYSRMEAILKQLNL